MTTKIRQFFSNRKLRDAFNLSSIGTYIIGIVALSVAWSSIKVIQRNYQLLKEISVLEQEVALAQSKADNQRLQNEYYKSDAFLELAARRQFNKAASGEQLMIVPKEVALAKVPALPDTSNTDKEADADQNLSNWQLWFQFLSGRGIDD